MAKRKGLSKRTRFEVFKRDCFKCQYCGAVPPDAVLEIDHILAVANGGGNEPENLLTACEACNAGKSDKPLTNAMEMAQNRIDATFDDDTDAFKYFCGICWKTIKEAQQ